MQVSKKFTKSHGIDKWTYHPRQYSGSHPQLLPREVFLQLTFFFLFVQRYDIHVTHTHHSTQWPCQQLTVIRDIYQSNRNKQIKQKQTGEVELQHFVLQVHIAIQKQSSSEMNRSWSCRWNQQDWHSLSQLILMQMSLLQFISQICHYIFAV